MSAKASKESKISRCFKAPMRVLSKARDFYIRSMSECAGQVGFGAAMGCPAPHISSLPRSFSVGSSSSSYDQDFRELVRAASTRSLGGKVDLEFRRRQSPATGVNVVPRSQSVAVGRIDEDKPCEFGEDFKVMTADMYPRSRSYAVSTRNGMVL
ncbi:hypothetical protein RJ639_017476 [Escallonia herrerae]|uniref:Uncharacterized protein n=1 Tax=Escallonia herrerae TaxID=1293975 RepID=A0AA88VHA8_9ASTE|nr:hypothetical protein RJ639_017476 [Escallonia herrerae]